uniref:Reverse transcriptase domain-containing protein n=1 Tax=Tanacetum cinerariifolium TaxID=118510 RepID=A0A6L2P3E3_TANCI|nr:reverse transcriptase domain-containing protein [Tanacetum cinerariifolium]
MPDESPPDTSVVETQQEPWTLFTDGSSCVDGSGAAEYEALIAGLRITTQIGVQNVHVSLDSKLVPNQVLGSYVAKKENMIKYLEKVKSLPLTPITGPWPFYKWKIDIAGPFPEGPVKHSQSSGLVERANRSLEEGIKAHLGERNKNWIEELPHVLWAHRTMIKSSHGDTPFTLTYGTKAVIPAEIGMPTYRTVAVDVVHNDEELRLNLDLLEKRHERAAIREAKANLKMTKYYNARVRGVTFRAGDFVYHSNDHSHVVDGGKLGSKWEGPYKVTEALRDGAYKLTSADGTVLPRT